MASMRMKKSATVTRKPSGSAVPRKIGAWSGGIWTHFTRKPSGGAVPRKAPTTREAAHLFSMELTPALKPEQVARLRKSLSGYVGTLNGF